MQCDDLAEVLSDAADGSVMLDRAARRHVDRCLRCQAELVQYRKLLRALHNLRTEVLEPHPGLLADILAHIEEAGEAGPCGRCSPAGAPPMWAGSRRPPPPGRGAILFRVPGPQEQGAPRRLTHWLNPRWLAARDLVVASDPIP